MTFTYSLIVCLLLWDPFHSLGQETTCEGPLCADVQGDGNVLLQAKIAVDSEDGETAKKQKEEESGVEARAEESHIKAVEPPPIPPMTIIEEAIGAFEGQDSSSVCGDGEDIVSTNCLGPTSMVKSQASATARMMMGGCCTAWLVKAATSTRGALMLSTGHCGSATTASFNFNYIEAACGKASTTTQTCTGTKLSVEEDKDEQAIYELEKPCAAADAATPILLDIGTPDIGEGMYILGHPNCRPQLLSHQEVHDTGHHCEVRAVSTWNTAGGPSQRIAYYCDTQGGNSGSPVFSARTGYAFAIHSHGGCSSGQDSANWGGLLKNSGVVAAFNQFGIPYVDRASTDIFKYENFQKKTSCFDHAGSVTLPQKTLAQCKQLCVNSLTCVSIGHSASTSTCEVNYRTTVAAATCVGDEENWERIDTLTTTLQHAGTFTTAGPTTEAPTVVPGSSIAWSVSTGPCNIDGAGCAMSPNFPSNYADNQGCSISVSSPGEVEVNHFQTEGGYDKLTVMGTTFSGELAEAVAQVGGKIISGSISWTSDVSVQNSGWKLCPKVTGTVAPPSTTTAAPPPTTAAPPTTTPVQPTDPPTTAAPPTTTQVQPTDPPTTAAPPTTTQVQPTDPPTTAAPPTTTQVQPTDPPTTAPPATTGPPTNSVVVDKAKLTSAFIALAMDDNFLDIMMEKLALQ